MNATEKVLLAASDPKALHEAIGDAEIIPLLMCLVQLTGYTDYLRQAKPYIRGAWDYLQTIPKPLQARIRADLEKAILDAASSGRQLPELPAEDLVDEMIATAVGKKLDPEYHGVFYDEANFGSVDSRQVNWRNETPPKGLKEKFVVVIGAGFSGVCAGIKLKELGIPFVIIEKNNDVAGTWLENVYPGIGVDTPCHFYSYAFEPNPDWSAYFSDGEEIRKYIAHCAVKYDIMENIRFGEEVSRALFDEKTASWNIEIHGKDGTTETLNATAVISCVGALNRPMIPAMDGKETFSGPAFHTAAWDKKADLRGKRVVMIGTGASGIQVAPTIAPDVEHLTIIQRSPHWVIKHPLYHLNIPSSVRWCMRNLPYYVNWYRFNQYYAASDGFHSTLSMDPNWEHSDISLNAENHRMRDDLIRYIKDELSDRPDLLDKCLPDYPPFGKRMLRDNNWFVTLKRDNVDIVASGVDRIEPDAVIAGGKRIPADVIIYATGFHAGRMLWPMDIQGRDGVSLRELWGEEDPRAHMGMTVPGFPNFFICYGPNTNLAHGGSAVFHTECQVRYIMSALREMFERDAASMEVRPTPFEAYNQQIDDRLRKMVWSHPGVTSWYKAKSGRIIMNSPWRLVDYRNMTSEFDNEEFEFKEQLGPCEQAKAAAQ